MIEENCNEHIVAFLSKWFPGVLPKSHFLKDYIPSIVDWTYGDGDWGFNIGRNITDRMGPEVDDMKMLEDGSLDLSGVVYSEEAKQIAVDQIRMIHKIHKEIVDGDQGECLVSTSEYIREFKKNQQEYGYEEAK